MTPVCRRTEGAAEAAAAG